MRFKPFLCLLVFRRTFSGGVLNGFFVVDDVAGAGVGGVIQRDAARTARQGVSALGAPVSHLSR